MTWLQTVTNRIETIQAVIDYRLFELEQHEKELKRPLNEEDQKWIAETSQTFENEITALCFTGIDQIKKLPQFLVFHPSIHKCSITGQPIRHVIKPSWPETMIWDDDTMPLLDILYEEEALNKHNADHPDVAPPKWPLEYLPWNRENAAPDKARQRDLEQKILVTIIKDLRQYCPFVPKDKV